MNWDDPIIAAAHTDTGMRRSNNQDSHALVPATSREKWQRHGHLFLVADGMGAHAVGELASKMACENIPHNYTKTRDVGPADAMIKAFGEVGALIHGKATANREFQGMGTTCSTLVLLPVGALIAHVGDSRVYRVRDGRIDQLTFDHSLVWELVRHKHLTQEQAQKAIPRNVITRSLGPDPVVEVDIEGPYAARVGDVYLLCSDGLSGPVADPELGAFASHFHPEKAAQYLTHLANLRGGQDNITTLVVRVGAWDDEGSGEKPMQPAAAAAAAGHGFRLSNLLATLQRKAPKVVTVEERIYQTADCPLTEDLIQRLGEDVRQAQGLALQQSWGLDWPRLAVLRREAEDARSSGDDRRTLRRLGEAIAILGTAARLHRKGQNLNGAH